MKEQNWLDKYIKNVKSFKRLWKINNHWFTIRTIYGKIALTIELERECQKGVPFDSFYSL